MTICLTEEAEEDLRGALRSYEAGGAQLRDDFRAELDACFARLLANPSMYPKAGGEVRRALLRRFPYAVFYLSLPDEIVVLGVLHERRNPDEWRSRAGPYE